MTHKEQRLAELEKLYDKDFKIPDGLGIPLGNGVLIKECPQEEQVTQAGIIVPGSNKFLHTKLGIVYSLGENVTAPIKPGMKVAFEKTCTQIIMHDNVQYIDCYDHNIKVIMPPKNYVVTHVPDNEEKRREVRIEATANSAKIADRQMDEINNG